MATLPALVDRLRNLWRGQGQQGVGIFSLAGKGGSQGVFLGQGWDFMRIANAVYGNPTGYRCVESIAANFSRPPWMLLPRDAIWPQLSNEVHSITDNPLLKLLNQPNASMSATTFQRTMSRDLELTGKFFAVKMQGTDGMGSRGRTKALRRLPPQRMTIVGNQDDELLGFVYTDRNGRQVPALPESIVYLHYPHPERLYDGMAPALIAGLPAETDTASARFNKDLLTNDGAMPGYMVLEGLTPDQFAQWKLNWETGQLPGKTRFMAGTDAKYVRVGMTNQELTYQELREDSQDDVMRAFGVPRAVAFDVSHETYANAEREQALFMQHNILPKWILICDELTQQLGDEFGVMVAMNLAGIDELQDSRDAVTERGIKLMSMKAMTINEFRRSQGWPDVDWGDEPQAPIQPMSAVPLAPGDTNLPPAPGAPPGTPGGVAPVRPAPARPAGGDQKKPAPSGNGNGKTRSGLIR